MKVIQIKHLKLVNFKGVRDLEIDFNDTVTTISGRNGSGKTTVLDAFTWLLFGKDGLDRKQFNLKTLDENGVAIPQLPHEVSAIICVDGKEIKLCRRYNEIWRRRQGTRLPEFDGHEEERIFDDVPCSVREWADKINAIVEESVFKFITIPSYFPTRKPEVQRKMLFDMAGRISDEEIAASNPTFQKLLKDLDGKTMEEYKRSINAKKSKLKDEAKDIPARINERKRSMPEAEDWGQLEAELKKYEEEQAGIDKQLGDITEAHRAEDKRRNGLSEKLSDLESKRQKRVFDIKQEVSKSYYDALQKRGEHSSAISLKEADLDALNASRELLEKKIEAFKRTRQNLLEEWKQINAETLVFDDAEFICPTCKRPLDPEDIESKKDELRANFNRRKSQSLEENKRKGLENKEKMEKTEKELEETNGKIKTLTEEIEKMKAVTFDEVTEPDASEAIANDAELKGIDSEIEKVKAELETEAPAQDTTELQQRKSEISDAITNIKIRLAKREDIEKDQKRIDELEGQLRTLNDGIAQYEGIEMTMLEFSKAKASAIEGRVNSMFRLVRFKMFDTLVNGTEVETCVATVNGVPYGDGLNSAQCINGGIDIINAICNHVGVRAPIFIDNAESVNELLATDSQLVRLVVSNDKQLTIS